MNKIIEKNKTSDLNPTMVANKTYDSILVQVRASNLNFHLHISPFSAIISIKKSLIKDQFGSLLLPPTSSPLSIHQNALNADIAALKIKTLELEAQTKMDIVKKEP